MKDYLYLGSAPHGEDCVQVSRDSDYLPAMRAECLRYIDALRGHYGPEPDGARITIKKEAHDFGGYLEVVCVFDDNDEEAVDYALALEDGLEHWPTVPNLPLAPAEVCGTV
jgi:hypothetical protein